VGTVKCSVEGCDQKKHVRGLCKRHDYRVRTHGSPGPAGLLRPGGVCSIDWCSKTVASHGLCATHAHRRRRHGDPLARSRGGEATVTYEGAHSRLAALWGSASQYLCVTGCGSSARHWAYDGTDPSQGLSTINGSALWYSSYPEFYMPMCARCHGQRDGALARAELREYREWKLRTGRSLVDA
jgi:hypothetical protein